MQKRHFELVARIIASQLGTLNDPRAMEYVYTVRLAHEFATAFAGQNPRFDRARFLKACGLGA